MSPEAISTILSDREKQITTMFARGLTAREIGSELSVSHKTVEAHKSNVYKKAGINSIAELTLLAVKLKLVQV